MARASKLYTMGCFSKRRFTYDSLRQVKSNSSFKYTSQMNIKSDVYIYIHKIFHNHYVTYSGD